MPYQIDLNYGKFHLILLNAFLMMSWTDMLLWRYHYQHADKKLIYDPYSHLGPT